MAVLEILTNQNPILRKTSRPVAKITKEIKKLVADMHDTLRSAPGVGLAAPQVGVSLRLAVINVTPEERKNQFVIINPVIVKKEGKAVIEEGCLSLPGVGGAEFKRAAKVTVTALNEKGLPITITGGGLLARALQHEIDHLDGKLIINRAPLKRRLEMAWAIRKLKKEKLW